MSDYFQTHLNVTPWDRARTRSALSTIQGAAVQVEGGTLMIISPPNQVIDRGPVAGAQLTVKGLAGLTAGVVVHPGERSWMVDFGSVSRREETKRNRKQGAAGLVKIFAGSFNVKGGFDSVKKGKALRDQFVETLSTMGATVEHPAE